MTADFLQQITTHGAAVNLSSRAKFRLTGADRVRYLNGQVTNDMRRVKPDESLYACVTDEMCIRDSLRMAHHSPSRSQDISSSGPFSSNTSFLNSRTPREIRPMWSHTPREQSLPVCGGTVSACSLSPA